MRERDNSPEEQALGRWDSEGGFAGAAETPQRPALEQTSSSLPHAADIFFSSPELFDYAAAKRMEGRE